MGKRYKRHFAEQETEMASEHMKTWLISQGWTLYNVIPFHTYQIGDRLKFVDKICHSQTAGEATEESKHWGHTLACDSAVPPWRCPGIRCSACELCPVKGNLDFRRVWGGDRVTAIVSDTLHWRK